MFRKRRIGAHPITNDRPHTVALPLFAVRFVAASWKELLMEAFGYETRTTDGPVETHTASGPPSAGVA